MRLCKTSRRLLARKPMPSAEPSIDPSCELALISPLGRQVTCGCRFRDIPLADMDPDTHRCIKTGRFPVSHRT